MKKTLLTALITACCLMAGQAHAADPSCEAKAVDKNGKALSGAAKAASIKKCEAASGSAAGAAATAPSCEAKAVDKNGKALAGAAKASSIKKCEAAAGSAKK